MCCHSFINATTVLPCGCHSFVSCLARSSNKGGDLSGGKQKGQGLEWLLEALAPGEPLQDLSLEQNHHLTDTNQAPGLCWMWVLTVVEETRASPKRQERTTGLGSL